MPDIRHRVGIAAPAQRVYSTLATEDGLTDFWTDHIDGHSEVGGKLSFYFGFPEPAAVKLATGLRGLKTGPLIVPLSPQKQKDLDSFRDWFQRWLPAVRKLAANA